MAMQENGPIYRQVRKEILANIRDAIWKPGEAITSELSLAKKLNVAPGTVRRAFDTLVEEGVIERRHGRGTFVRRANFDFSLFRHFRWTNGASVDLHPESRVLSLEVLPAPDEVSEALQLESGRKALFLNRERAIEKQPMLFDEIWLPLPEFDALLAHDIVFESALYPQYERLCDQYVSYAVESLSAKIAGSEDAEAGKAWNGQAIIKIERVALNPQEKPIEFRRSFGRAENFQFRMTVR